jgi:hypothetical protein
MSEAITGSATIVLEDPVAMCHTFENNYWCHGWVDKAKFRGRLLSRTPYLEGEEDARDIIHGKVKRGWIVTVAGDTSGCGWDATMHFLTEPLAEGATHYAEVYDEDGEKHPAEIIDGPHKVTWWEPMTTNQRELTHG